MMTPELLASATSSLRQYCVSLCRGRRDDADDLMQDTLARALQFADKFDGDAGGARRWLFTIAHNQSVDIARRSPKTATVPIEAAVSLGIEDKQVEAIALKQLLFAARRAPGAGAELVIRHAIGDKYEELAERVGIPMGTVRSRMSRGRAQLRESYA
jgi:RNA polymerase sigma-70 factor (ECF subfamily)